MQEVTFDGRKEKTVHPGEFFSTDEVTLAPKTGAYICLEISFSGTVIPYHEESIIPSFVLTEGVEGELQELVKTTVHTVCQQ